MLVLLFATLLVAYGALFTIQDGKMDDRRGSFEMYFISEYINAHLDMDVYVAISLMK